MSEITAEEGWSQAAKLWLCACHQGPFQEWRSNWRNWLRFCDWESLYFDLLVYKNKWLRCKQLSKVMTDNYVCLRTLIFCSLIIPMYFIYKQFSTKNNTTGCTKYILNLTTRGQKYIKYLTGTSKWSHPVSHHTSKTTVNITAIFWQLGATTEYSVTIVNPNTHLFPECIWKQQRDCYPMKRK